MISRKASILPGRLARKYKSTDPFEIAEALDIEVLERSDFKRQKGAFKVILNNSFIFINANLSDEMKRLVCAHELGHALLHRSLGNSLGAFRHKQDSTLVAEQATIFSACLFLCVNI